MKGLILFITGFALYLNLQAQNSPQMWSLEECILYAIEHNIDIKQRVLQKERAEINLNTSQMSRLPNLNGNMGQNWNFGRTDNTESGLYENQTLSNTNFSLSSSTPIFTGFRIKNEIAKNKWEVEAAMQNLEKAKEDLALNVASLYLQVLFNKELLKVSKEQLALSQFQVQKTEFLVDGGKVPMSQLYDIKAQVAKDQVAVVQDSNNLRLSLLDLAQRLELENFESFDITVPETDRLIENAISSILPPENIYKNAITFKPQIKEQEFLLESSRKSLKIAESGYMPNINLNLNYGTGYYYNYDMKGVVNQQTGNPINRPFSDQFKNNAGEGIGLSMSVPIFNRFSVKNQVKNAKAGILNQQLALDNTKKNLYKEIQTAYLNATAAREKYNASSLAIMAAKESFKYAQERYEAGKSTVFEFNESKTKWTQSLSEQIQAKYDYIFRSKILDFYNGNPIKL